MKTCGKWLLATLLLAVGAGADDWTTIGYDAQRSGWVRADRKINPQSVQGPEFEFLWKLEFDGEGTLSPPVLLDFLIAPQGFRSLGFVGSPSGSVFVMDTDLSRPEWERHFDFGARPAPTPDCPGGMTSSVTRPTVAALPALGGFVARGRRTPGKSGVGKPNEGAVTLAAAPPPAPSPAATRESPRVRPPARAVLRGLNVLYSLTADGMLRTVYVSNGRDHEPPAEFLPPNANARGLIVVDGVAYVATTNGCGGVADGVWALDLESKDVASWKAPSAMAGMLGPAIGSDGTVYAATEDGVFALEAATLKQLRKSQSASFASSPVLFDFDGKDHLAAAGSDGKIRLYDAGALGAPVAESGSGAAQGALAAWRDASGRNWLLGNGAGKITAWRIDQRDSGLRLTQAWTSKDIPAPLPPIVVNGVVFAASGGRRGTDAVLYALDGATGEPLWDSGDAIESTASGYALSAGPSHIYVATDDSSLYSFGIGIEY